MGFLANKQAEAMQKAREAAAEQADKLLERYFEDWDKRIETKLRAHKEILDLKLDKIRSDINELKELG